jgi:hypothetical protein
MKIRYRENIGDTERLRDIALPLDFAHSQRISADAVRSFGERYVGESRPGRG